CILYLLVSCKLSLAGRRVFVAIATRRRTWRFVFGGASTRGPLGSELGSYQCCSISAGNTTGCNTVSKLCVIFNQIAYSKGGISRKSYHFPLFLFDRSKFRFSPFYS
ncbi:hypothetical protein L9F63_017851, partial [Diploptera punctata]